MENKIDGTVKEFFDSLFQSEDEKELANENAFETEVDVDGAIEKYKEYDTEEKRLKGIYDGRIAAFKEKFDAETEKIEKQKKWLSFNLRTYVMMASDKKETKSMFKKKYLSGEVQIKKPVEKLNKPTLTEDVIKTSFPEFIKNKVDLDWAELKATLTITGGQVFSTVTGEDLTDKIPIELAPEKIVIK